MTKKRGANARKNAPRRPKASTRTVGVIKQRGLDSLGSSYARLLADPCGAPLVHPVYPGGDAGFLFRADAVASYCGGVGETSGVLHWTPGYANASNSDLIVTSGATSATALTMAVNNTGPGKAFLTANAFGARCVAACLKISYPGAESARSGRIHYGHTQGGTIDAGDVVTVDSVAPLLQHYTRTPPEIIELFWRPGIADTEFNDPNASASATLKDRKSSITVAWAGLPAAVGITFHYTAIYEWTPKPGVGVSTNTSGKNQSVNTMDEVIDALTKSGFMWVRNAASAGMSGLARGALSAITNHYGIMPAIAQTARRLTFR